MSTSPSPLNERLPWKRVTVGRLVDVANAFPVGFGDWRHGVAFVQHNAVALPQPLESYTGIDGVVKCRVADLAWDGYPAPAAWSTEAFYPTQLVATDGCDSFDDTGPAESVRAALEDASTGLAMWAWTGRAGTTGSGATPLDIVAQTASLWDAGVVSASAVAPVKALQGLIAAARDAGYYGQLTFHMRDDAIPALKHAALIEENGGAFTLFGGHKLIADPGYPKRIEASSPAAGTVWVVATGPVFAALDTPTEMVPYDRAGAGWKCTLEKTFIQKRMGIVAWDPAYAWRSLMTIDA